MNNATSLIRKHPELYNPGSAESFFLAHGHEMPWRPFPSELQGGEKKYCYVNAYQLATQLGLVYCEGVALRHGVPIPVSHAWCLDVDGFVIDPTWVEESTDAIPVYFGVAFEEGFVAKLKSEGTEASITDGGSGRCPVFDYPASDWKFCRED